MPHRFLRLPEVKQRVGLSRSSIYLRITQGTFVTPIRLGPNSVAWLEEDIDRWMAERMAGADKRSDEPAEMPAEQRKAAADPILRAEVRVGLTPRAPRYAFTAEQARPASRMSARDGRR